MTPATKLVPLYRRPAELGRRAVGVVAEFGIKAYGAAAALSAALSDSETAGGKAYDAVHAVPNLRQRWDEAQYVVDHREQIQTTLDYVNANAPDASQLETAARASSETLGQITTTYGEVNQAWDSVKSIRPTNVLDTLPAAKDHLQAAWSQKPGLDSIQQLADKAEGVAPFLRQVGSLDIDFARVYGELLSVLDNFASDEIVGTVSVMVFAVVLAWVLGLAAGFWARRGRPGIVVSTVQRLGVRAFPRWYARNLEHALGSSVYAVARRRIQHDLVADPAGFLDQAAYEELERHFRRAGAGPAPR
ncbi:hypothetical protein ASD62_11195 [Phycicoccus sp. Root563]|uniref:hypothetical protein n=1 Tax=Phycicoccus sp. Root563 TaxID=1736562 RepID=UPI0007037BCA|nr:hypothetical protein [Phycicoccus sp. Root563]KQZ89784.1 hypothetical protein ASD62_11195 [Phycicoccus sp. Root563]